jgi:putative ATPase
MLAAGEAVRARGALPVPLALRNAPTPLMKGLGYGDGYRYPHDYENAVVAQDCLPDDLVGARFYQPSDRGAELAIGERMERQAEAKRTSSRTPRHPGPEQIEDED